MFPYLRTKKQFLEDCRTISYKIVKDKNKEYVLEKLSQSDEKKIRLMTAPFPNNNCGCENFHCSDLAGPCTKNKVIYVPTLVGWLIHNLNIAEWGKISSNNVSSNIGNNKTEARVSFSSIKSWCRSITQYMYEVLNNPNVPESIMVGLEYYIDYSGNDSRTRVDMILAGYGLSGRKEEKRIAIVELKQWSNIDIQKVNGKIMWTTNEESAVTQVCSYRDKIITAIGANPEQVSDPIQIFPCVYMHDLGSQEKTIKNTGKHDIRFSKDTNAGTKQYAYAALKNNAALTNRFRVMYEYGIDNGVPVFLKDSADEFAKYIGGVFNCSSKSTDDARNVIRELKKRYEIFDINKMAEIIKKPNKYNDYKEKLRRDQKDVLEKIEKHINKEGVDVIYGPPGSGKTLIAFLLRAYCKNNQIKKCKFLHKGAAPKNAIEQLSVQYSDYYKDVQPGDHLDVIIFDEAHKFNGDSTNLKNICDAGRHLIFLMDLEQAIEEEENDGLKLITSYLKKNAHNDYYLWTQFRCNQDEGYVSWVEQVLGMQTNTSKPLLPQMAQMGEDIYLEDLDFDVELIGVKDNGSQIDVSPNGLNDFINEITNIVQNKSPLICSSEMDNIAKQLTLKTWDVVRPGLNFYKNIQDHNVGGIYQVHGLEAEATLVVINDDLKYDDKTSKMICSGNMKYITRQYRVLLTRGMRKCYIFCVDPGMRMHLAKYWKKNKNVVLGP